jgi:hypothetical protein
MLYAVHLFPKVHTVNLNWHRISCNPYIQNITDSGDAFPWQDNATGVLVTPMAYNIISEIFHAEYLPLRERGRRFAEKEWRDCRRDTFRALPDRLRFSH